MTHKATLAVRTGIETDQQHGAVVPPIYLSSNYTFADFGEPRQYDYARSGNPTRTNLADALAALEGGAGAVVTGTGMGAVHLVTTALLKAGDLLLAPHDCYGGTWRLFEYLAAKGHYRVQFVDQGMRPHWPPHWRKSRRWYGSRPPPTRCCGWWISAPSPAPPTR